MREAAEALRLTAQDLKNLGICDQIISEPKGGAHRDRKATMKAVGAILCKSLDELGKRSPDGLMKDRRQKFLDMGTKGLAS